MKLKKNIAVSDSGFIFNPATGVSYFINPIGSMIVTMMKESKNDYAIIENPLAHEFNPLQGFETLSGPMKAPAWVYEGYSTLIR